jgi:hypothetical protein
VRWRSFAENEITARGIPIKPCFIDASTIRNNAAASRYVIDIMKDSLSKDQKVDLALSYRMMKDAFLAEDRVRGVNEALAQRKGEISEKTPSVSLDTSSRTSWETGVMPHLDDVPLTLVGKGEQDSVKIKLAMASSTEAQVILIEEAENHLSFSNLNVLISHIAERRGTRQLVITTHSSFVLNKLGIESVILFHRFLARHPPANRRIGSACATDHSNLPRTRLRFTKDGRCNISTYHRQGGFSHSSYGARRAG